MGDAKRRRRATKGSVRSQVQRILHTHRQAQQVAPELRTEGVPFSHAPEGPRVVPPLERGYWPGQAPRGRKRG